MAVISPAHVPLSTTIAHTYLWLEWGEESAEEDRSVPLVRLSPHDYSFLITKEREMG
jgi:hypothetical protein